MIVFKVIAAGIQIKCNVVFLDLDFNSLGFNVGADIKHDVIHNST